MIPRLNARLYNRPEILEYKSSEKLRKKRDLLSSPFGTDPMILGCYPALSNSEQISRYSASFPWSKASALVLKRDAFVCMRDSLDIGLWKRSGENGRRTVAVPAEARRPGRFVLQLHWLALTGKESPFLRGGGLNGDLIAGRLVATAADTAMHHHAAGRAAGVG